MATRGTPEARSIAADVTAQRRVLVLDAARAEGLVGDDKDTHISGRVRRHLVEAAKRRSGIDSDTGLIEYALARVALEDDFGDRLVARKGTIPPDIDLGI
ncbi:hypothetical protein [Arenibaculum sp.]|jgi:hypothetical protein|uniref:hypothetical protein n=1 Tax=Arenibaculum sp. TaxID=2865862 RepID=UPI002E0DCD2C|nr:hypothetical protein [Arenibaculum sp.]